MTAVWISTSTDGGTMPEPTSIADAHAAICRFRGLANPTRLRVLINQTTSTSESVDVLDQFIASSRQFLGAVISPLGTGSIRSDPIWPGLNRPGPDWPHRVETVVHSPHRFPSSAVTAHAALSRTRPRRRVDPGLAFCVLLPEAASRQ